MSEDSGNSTSISEAVSGLGDQVDTAVAGNAKQESSQETERETDAYGNPTGGTRPVAKVAKEAQQTLKNPNASQSAKIEAKKTLKKLTLKVDGEEFEEELPFDLPDDPKALEYMKRELQLAKMGQKRAQHAAGLEKDIVQFFDELQKNPKKALSNPLFKERLDLKKLAVEIMEDEIENSKKSPEQLELEKNRAELQAIREEREQEKQQAAAREHERLTEQYSEEYDKQITQAFETNRIPKTQLALSTIANYMDIAIQNGKDISINDLIPIVREDLSNGFQNYLSALPDEELDQYIPKAIQDRLRKKGLAKAKQVSSNPALKGASKAPSIGKQVEKKEVVKPETMKKFFGF
jgi:hypothetical protein